MRIRLSGNALLGWLIAIVILVFVLFGQRSSLDGFQACTKDQYSVTTCMAKKENNASCSASNECKSNTCTNRKCVANVPVLQPGAFLADVGKKPTATCSIPGVPPVNWKGKLYCPCPDNKVPSGEGLNEGCKVRLSQRCQKDSDCASNACRKPQGAPVGVCERVGNCDRMPC